MDVIDARAHCNVFAQVFRYSHVYTLEYAFILLNSEKFWNQLRRLNRAGKVLHAFVRRGKVGPKKTELLFF